eukprot:Gregarina_sp_Poly_1__4213@NODE_22_length_20656_cov_110_706397_g20_i0_p5_GENE_NODE_22_length_20656_cov_110_706397_g20_i0NODE_22_length_20656_cov_110_706397_g20_i0_p5_ORF_typecomplete_len520_score80_95DUF4003/PF13170_6/0_33_NODE_22_length_20656_cov_110_706397_g20_i053736932
MQPPAFRVQVLKRVERQDHRQKSDAPVEDARRTTDTLSQGLVITRPAQHAVGSPVLSRRSNDPLTDEGAAAPEWVELEELGATRLVLDADGPAAQKSQYVVQAWNDVRSRGVRVTQRELSVIGTNKVITKIEVIEHDLVSPTADDDATMLVDNVVFSVKHTHNLNWRKQLSIHKNLLLACILAGVECPIEIPEDSVKVFKSIENSQHVHIYLERVIPHFRFRTLPPQVSAFWWRAVGHGSLVFQNWATGRVLALPCKQKGVPAAAETLQRALTLLNNMPQQFFDLDMDYAQINLAADEEAAANEHQTLDTLERVAEAIQSWALEDGVSPWMTKLIVKCSGSRKGQILQYRYSIGVDVAPASSAASRPYLAQQGESAATLAEAAADTQSWEHAAATAQIYVALQVHCNEPLSRELKAFPVCMLPVAIEDFSFREVTALYLRSLWFLRKLFEYHQGAEEALNAGGRASHRASPSSAQQPGFLRNIKAQDDKDLNARNKLAGGARLCHPKYVAAVVNRHRIA